MTISTPTMTPAAIDRSKPQTLGLSGAWTVNGMGQISPQLNSATITPSPGLKIDGARIDALDATGAWVINKLLLRLGTQGHAIQLHDLRPEFSHLLGDAGQQSAEQTAPILPVPTKPVLERIGRSVELAVHDTMALLGFVGLSAVSLAKCIPHPAQFRGRSILFNIRSAGVDALPIVGLLTFLLGVVVAYQSANQLRQYGANIFVVDLIGLSMLREFAPLITAIIVAGRSGSAYTAQIGTMAVTEEIDAMRTLGIDPHQMLVVPKIIALMITLPLLTVFADVLGVFGGMIMAQATLGVGFAEFLDRFTKAVNMSAYLLGIGKAVVFAAIIAVVGCYQGFLASGGPDSIGRQTTRSVVQGIFLVIVVDALFSIAFSALDL
ncbi:MlaE family ABC transporter permease [Solimicrobium silvestre]|uniref:ABC-type transport system involved in resistance to organic solvents permease component n=1 Tax=Solimicrobium silvestre TaxID=2099400 RepID=A0A2S9GUP1_9BURK|nr:ABC transporter permease [Solimicrobium silvestre]PRC91421.1 hypothetical protein S2091_3836 [Solimicrobium silvestre]